MKVVLRIIAVWLGLATALFALLLFHFFGAMRDAGLRTLAALALVVVCTGVSAFAAVQLWRLRESGRLAAITLCVASAGVTLWQVRTFGAGDVIRLALVAVAMLVLLSRGARRACAEAAVVRMG